MFLFCLLFLLALLASMYLLLIISRAVHFVFFVVVAVFFFNIALLSSLSHCCFNCHHDSYSSYDAFWQHCCHYHHLLLIIVAAVQFFFLLFFLHSIEPSLLYSFPSVMSLATVVVAVFSASGVVNMCCSSWRELHLGTRMYLKVVCNILNFMLAKTMYISSEVHGVAANGCRL